MQSTTIFLSGAFATFLLSASAQITLTHEISGSPSPGTYQHVQDYATSGASFLNLTGKGGVNPWEVSPIGTKRTEITTNDGTFTVYDLCTEMFVGPTGTSDYSVTSGLGFSAWSSTLQNDVAILLENALLDGGFEAARFDYELGGTTTYDDVAVFGAALQIALWELVEDDADPFNGNLIFLSDLGASLPAPDTNTLTTDAVNLAGTWLTNISDGTWTESDSISLFYSDGTEAGSASVQNQDRVFFGFGVSITSIPEPSTALFTLIGGALLVSRRRR